MNWTEFFNMGGYGFFVWTSWGLTLLVLTLNIILPSLKSRSIKNSIKRETSRERKISPEHKSSPERKNNLERKKSSSRIKTRDKKPQK